MPAFRYGGRLQTSMSVLKILANDGLADRHFSNRHFEAVAQSARFRLNVPEGDAEGDARLARATELLHRRLDALRRPGGALPAAEGDR